jgi:hypothetical protein
MDKQTSNSDMNGQGGHARASHKRQRLCQHCGNSFSKAEHLSRHIRSHTKEKPFACTICAKKYGRQDSLLRHMKFHIRENHANALRGTTAGVQSRRGSVENDSLAELPNYASMPMAPDAIPSMPSLDASVSWNGSEAFSYREGDFPINATNLAPNILDTDLLPNRCPSFDYGDFGIPPLSSSVAAAIADWGWLSGDVPSDYQQSMGSAQPSPNTIEVMSDARSAASVVTRVQRTWYTNLIPDVTATRIRKPSQQEKVDENYRASLVCRLQVKMNEDSLPSSDFLVCWPCHLCTLPTDI